MSDTSAPIVHANFLEDLRQHYVAALQAIVPTAAAHDKAHDACIAYFNVMHRLIPTKPRRVLRSSALRSRQLSPEHRQAVDTIAEEAERGDDLRPRLSRSVTDPSFNDRLMNDWRIHHLHLGSKLEADGFVQRTGPLLYVMVRDDVIYFIDLLAHGTKSFANQDLVDILDAEWPEAIADGKLGAIPGSLQPASLAPKERHRFREKLNFATQAASGNIYKMDMVTLSGLSFTVVDQANRQCNGARQTEDNVRQKAQRIRDMIAGQTSVELTELRLRYVVGPPAAVVEEQTGYRFT